MCVPGSAGFLLWEIKRFQYPLEIRLISLNLVKMTHFMGTTCAILHRILKNVWKFKSLVINGKIN